MPLMLPDLDLKHAVCVSWPKISQLAMICKKEKVKKPQLRIKDVYLAVGRSCKM